MFFHQFLALFGDCICLYIGLNGNRGPPFMSNHPPPVVSVSGLTWLTTKDTGDISVTIVNFHFFFFFLDCDVPLTASYSVYVSQLVRFARICNNVSDFGTDMVY